MENPIEKRLEEGLGTGTQPIVEEDNNNKSTSRQGKKDGIGIHPSNENEEKSVAKTDQPEKLKEEQPLIKQKTKRVATLDAFRGLTIVVNG